MTLYRYRMITTHKTISMQEKLELKFNDHLLSDKEPNKLNHHAICLPSERTLLLLARLSVLLLDTIIQIVLTFTYQANSSNSSSQETMQKMWLNLLSITHFISYLKHSNLFNKEDSPHSMKMWTSNLEEVNSNNTHLHNNNTKEHKLLKSMTMIVMRNQWLDNCNSIKLSKRKKELEINSGTRIYFVP